MAEPTGGQASFGWASEKTAPDQKGPPAGRRRARARRQPQRAAASQQVVANVGEAQLPPDNALWDVHAAAKFLGRSVSWVYHRAEDGTLPVKRLGGWGLRFIPAELRAWVETGGAAKPR